MKKQNDIFRQIRTLSKDLDHVGSLSDQNTKTIDELLSKYHSYLGNELLLAY